MTTSRETRRRSLICVAAATGLLMAGCSSNSASPAGGGAAQSKDGGQGTKVLFLPKYVGQQLFATMNDGAQEVGKGYGWSVDYDGPSNPSATDQVTFINQAVSKGYDAIAVSANDGAVVAPALKRAKAAGLTVITFDGDATPDSRLLYVENSDVVQTATIQLDMLGEQMNFSGDFAILSAAATDSSQRQWNAEVQNQLKVTPKYKNMRLVTIVNPSDDTQQTAAKYAEQLLKQYPDVKGIMAPTGAGLPAMAQVVSQTKQCQKYIVTGLGDPPSMKSYVQSGCVKVFAGQHFKRMGAVTMCALHAVMTKAITDADGAVKVGSDFDCQGEKISVEKDNVVLGSGFFRYSKENLSEFDS
jgi:rhamnose transport system substrate-binding protein